MTPLESFMLQTKKKCEENAKRMAELELNVWSKEHEKALIKNFGFTKESLRSRRTNLKEIAK